MKTRINFLDNLRTFLIFLVVVLHAGIVYEPILENTWIVSDPSKNSSIGIVRMYLDLFIMFILFFVSGYFIPVSVKRKSSWDFIKSKFKRIMVPWIVAVFTLIPAYKSIFLYSRGLPQEALYTYFLWFQRAGSDLGFYADNPAQNWLWFLPVLFLFQVIYLLMAKTKMLNLKISLKIGVVLTFVVGLVYSLIISYSGNTGWYDSALLHFQNERLLVYFAAFLLGTLCNKLNVFESDYKNKKVYILSNVVLTFALGIFTVVALNLFFNMIDPGRNYYFVTEWFDRLIYYSTALLSMLSFLYIFIYVFRFSFNKSNNLMKQLNRNSYSVYIIHVIVLGVIALPLLDIHIPAMLKFLILTILTFVISNTIVTAYRTLFHNTLALRVIKVATIIFILFSIGYYGIKAKTTNVNHQPPTKQLSQSHQVVGLHMAVIQSNLEAIRYHIKAGSDLDITEPSGGSSPLITAAVFGKTEAAKLLIEAGADVNFSNNDGSTPLHSAAFFCHPEIVEALLEKGADTTIKNNNGSTALGTVTAPFETVKGFYEYFENTLGPLGFVLDYEQIKANRPVIVAMLE